ncbi:protein translocase subunit secA [Desulfatibacillum alkenivorans DSM 16219]|jgi:preprotein translocase subunit SecA|uniref:Protein translocase subunit SecA n=1 Tax=Desulfatibacillum alkenivorans DSM 16219 TaxID=1121393 RepID=A0A1M6VNX1_9BACT|nr:preprotein translocase subunit SecA [Desulfatibacillum alkenivorans]SHK83267.1 protein translocase subunit secA [Desulfatibacillum alkenivorans DSM 16219]
MIGETLAKIFGTKNSRVIKSFRPTVNHINELEPKYQAMSDDELRAQTEVFKKLLADGKTLDDILCDAFAAVREASIRTLEMRHFDVQLIGGIVLHQGNIAEMKTGEGKTLVATLPAYLNALTGRGVHVVTVNDYLAARDTEWMGQIYRFLGMTVGTIVHGLDDDERQEAYNADITYGTNNEFGFDYLRDNMKYSRGQFVQRDHHFAIVDEVDSILIDEARTPLIISGPAEKSTQLYYQVDVVIPRLREEDHYTIDEKARTVVLTEEGVRVVESGLGVDNLYDHKNMEILHHVNQALKAHTLFKRDVDYIVKQGEVIIVDEFTGRLMPGRRYSDGLHQALEAKEKVKIENENQTLASITFQNYFRMYEKLSGMTGTADTEAPEFKKIYDLDVVVIPTNMPMIRKDFPDVIYRSKREKYEAVINEIQELHRKGQPVLVGTISIDDSETLAKMLKKRGVPHNVLNAKNHEGEAQIVANAGQAGSVTISTNMAGRGTDIKLGEGVKELGGLHILGTERHESRRIDNQLRGRSGRQGDPGSSRFYLSMDDDLLRIFGGERMSKIMNTLGMQEGEPIEAKILSRGIENAQAKVEAHNFEGRKHILEYDDVMNQQREVIYRQRREILSGESLRPNIEAMIEDLTEGIAAVHADDRTHAKDWDWDAINDDMYAQFGIRVQVDDEIKDKIKSQELGDILYQTAIEVYDAKEKSIGSDQWRNLEEYVMLRTVDSLWKDHLLSMDHLREGIGLRSYAQQQPLIVYKKEGFEMFQEMIDKIQEEVVKLLFFVRFEEEPEKIEEIKPKEQEMTFSHGGDQAVKKKPVQRKDDKVGRNSPCPCGSGKKYKKCCGA